MVAQLARHHGDNCTLTAGDLIRDMRGEAPWVHILVAEGGGALIGYAALFPLIRLQFGRRGMDMHHLFTEGRFGGPGVGRSIFLAAKAMATALSCDYLTVGTHPGNHAAQEFYESLGFTQQDAHPPRFVIGLG